MNTADEMHTLAHMKRFWASTFCAMGTQCPLEYTPMMRSTFSWSSRRVASLMATSAFDCASAWIASIMWPSTPPASFTRSMAMRVPIAAAFEPPPANGPV